MSDEERSVSEHRSLMADLRAAAEGTRRIQRYIYPSDAKKLLALLDAGKAVRQHTTCLAEDYIAPYKTCGCRACKVARQYDEAAK